MHLYLEKIVRKKKESVAKKKQLYPTTVLMQEIDSKTIPVRNFKNAVRRNKNSNEKMHIIAEIKKASPSKGHLSEFNVCRQAQKYQKGGASAISVLTEEDYFKGKLEYIENIKEKTTLPVLRKDFIIDVHQVYETILHGADAILFITSILSPEELVTFVTISKSLGLHPLVEVHNERELEIAVETQADIIGINNRDLDTFEVDIHTSVKLAPEIPKDKVIVAESGISSPDYITILKESNVDAVLVGEALVTSSAPEDLLRNLAI